AKIIATDPFNDICILKSNVHIYSTIEIGSADECVPGNSVAILGFPHADHGRLVLTEQQTNIGAKVLIENNGIKNKHLILNVQSRPGQSGSPIFDLKTKKLVAILIGSYAPYAGAITIGGIDPQTLHQTTHAVSAEYIKDMI
ncbi:S1 family peptidase, partial (plasmid) [Clostridium perfringens]